MNAQLCEDCEQVPATVTRTGQDGLPLAVCAGCDPGDGCRPMVRQGRYSNGTAMFTAHCAQCGWQSIGSASSRSSADHWADRHRQGLL